MTPVELAGLLAHQGGWDEILMVAVPVAVFAALLHAANKRAGRIGGTDHSGDAAGHAPDDQPRNDRAGPI